MAPRGPSTSSTVPAAYLERTFDPWKAANGVAAGWGQRGPAALAARRVDAGPAGGGRGCGSASDSPSGGAAVRRACVCVAGGGDAAAMNQWLFMYRG